MSTKSFSSSRKTRPGRAGFVVQRLKGEGIGVIKRATPEVGHGITEYACAERWFRPAYEPEFVSSPTRFDEAKLGQRGVQPIFVASVSWRGLRNIGTDEAGNISLNSGDSRPRPFTVLSELLDTRDQRLAFKGNGTGGSGMPKTRWSSSAGHIDANGSTMKWPALPCRGLAHSHRRLVDPMRL